MATAITRLYLRYPFAGSLFLDITDAQATVLAFTGGAATTSIGTRMQVVTRAKDSKAVYIAVDNIAGLELVAGAPAP